jgi:hypothetical protein
MAALNVERAQRAKLPSHNSAYNAPYEDPITGFVRQISLGASQVNETGCVSRLAFVSSSRHRWAYTDLLTIQTVEVKREKADLT